MSAVCLTRRIRRTLYLKRLCKKICRLTGRPARYAVLAVFFGAVSCLVTFASASPPRLNVETAIEGVCLRDRMNIDGWALNASGIREIGVYLDGVQVARCKTGAARADVLGRFPHYRTPDSGFRAQIRLDPSLAEGQHRLEVAAVGNDRETVSRAFTVRYRRSDTKIVFPSSEQTFYSNFTLTGRVFNAFGVRKVNVYADGKRLGEARCTPSPGAAGKEFPEGSCADFAYEFDLDRLPAGSHRITVENVGNDGHAERRQVSIVKATVRMEVETPPAAAPLLDAVHIKGWAMGVNGVKRVELLADGKKVGEVKTGLPRPDIYALYPSYQDRNSGFSIDLPRFYAVRSGAHTLTVRAVGSDGSAVQRSFRVKKNAPALHIDRVEADPDYPNRVVVSGWALNASGVKAVLVRADGTGTPFEAARGKKRPDLASKAGYLNPALGGFSCTLPVDLHAGHTFQVQAVGNDGETVAQTTGLYRLYPSTLDRMVSAELAAGAVRDGQKCTSEQAGWLKQRMDPAAVFANPETRYEFARLTARGPDEFSFVRPEALDAVFDRYGAGGLLEGKGRVFIAAARRYGVNPIYLASHAALESGWGRCAIVTEFNRAVYYNFYGIGAYDGAAVVLGGGTAVREGWDSADRAIYGAARWISEHYFQYGDRQNTLYEMRWNACDLHHQYATDAEWAESISKIMAKFYAFYPHAPVVYELPLYAK